MSLRPMTRARFLASLSVLAFAVLAACGPTQAVPKKPLAHHPSRGRKNGDVARLAGMALHLGQDAQALMRASLKRREHRYGRSDSQARADRRDLPRIQRKITYFRRVKRRSEGR